MALTNEIELLALRKIELVASNKTQEMCPAVWDRCKKHKANETRATGSAIAYRQQAVRKCESNTRGAARTVSGARRLLDKSEQYIYESVARAGVWYEHGKRKRRVSTSVSVKS